MSQYIDCIVTGDEARLGCWAFVLQYTKVYCDRSRGLLVGELYCKTTGCIVTERGELGCWGHNTINCIVT